MRYEPIDPMSREAVDAALRRAKPEELLRVVLAVALHSEDPAWATEVCLRLARHQHFNVRGNAILGLGHLARRFGRLDLVARTVIEEGLRDSDGYVRDQAESAADDAQYFLRCKISRPN
jgi:uncharacterized protein YbjT (DUF2867 family)